MSAVIPAVTDATAASQQELHEAIKHFLSTDPSKLEYIRCDGGVNNKCYVVKGDTSGEYLLRIYNNGGNSKRVIYEHAILQLLSSHKFSYSIPTLIPTLKESKTTMIELSNNTHACLFKKIPGNTPSGSAYELAYEIGKSTAELVTALKEIKVDLPLPNPLYRNMYDAHHFITRDSFLQLMKSDKLDHVRGAANDLLSELEKIELLISNILKLDPPLPEQQIHADLHVANVLIVDGKVSGVLDFEFSAPDWRCMELVVGLSKYIATSGAEHAFESYINGYSNGGGKLTYIEAQLIPELIILRVLNNVIYFAGRALAGEDDLSALTTRAQMYVDRCKWIRQKSKWMQDVIIKVLVK